MNTKQHKSNLIKIFVADVPQTSAIEQMRADVSVFESSLIAFDSSLNNFDTSLTNLTNDFSTFDLSVSRGLCQLNASILEIQQTIEGLSVSQIGNLETRLNSVDSSLIELNAAVRDVSIGLSYVRTVQTTANASIARLDASTAAAYVSINALNSGLSQAVARLDNNDVHLLNIDASINALRARNNLQDSSITILTNSFADVSNATRSNAARLETLNSSLTDTNAAVRDVSNLLGNTRSIQSVCNASVNRLDASTAAAYVSIQSLTSGLSQATVRLDNNDVHTYNIDASINALRARQNLQDSSITNLVSYVDTRNYSGLHAQSHR